MKKKIVIITQHIFPMQSPRSFRSTELAKEFGKLGHDVIIYAVIGNHSYSEFEIKNNVRVKAIKGLKFATLDSDGNSKTSFLYKIMSKLFKKVLLFPDIEFVFKVPNILLNETNIDILITVAIPYPIHWGAAYSKSKNYKRFPKIWIADCGDPFMGNKFIKYPFYFKYVEKWFCRNTNYITIPIEEAKKAYYKECHNKMRIIPQGFNFDGFDKNNNYIPNELITFVYAGSFYKGIRDPTLFLEYLSKLDKDFRFIVYTNSKILLEPFYKLLGNRLEVNDYIPREELLNVMSESDFLINVGNSTNIHSPSKLIDYTLADRPILNIDSKNLDESVIDDFLNRNYKKKYIIGDIEQYDIKNVAKKFLNLN